MSSEWGRVGDDGTVYVKTSDGERAVGQFTQGSPDEALAFYVNRYDQLAFEVEQLERRVHTAKGAPDETLEAVKALKTKVAEANAVGDLAALTARLDALTPLIAAIREQRKAERAAKTAEAKVAKEAIVEEAEKLAAGTDWRNGVDRLRELLEQWKALPRIDRSSDDSLWRRFSTARTTYTRRRKVHFAQLNEQRAGAVAAKEKLVEEAESLSTSTDWGATAGAFRDLMNQWKAAGVAAKSDDDKLWKRFRAAQDTFFNARDAAAASQEAEFTQNAVAKEAILVDAEKIVPVTDIAAAKAAYRTIAERWEQVGKVPRERIKELEGRLRKVEQAIRTAEDDQWRKTDPEKSARADDIVGKLEEAIAKVKADIEAAKAKGDAKKVQSLEENLASREMFLTAAKAAAADFS